jgi:hypothetical protein
VLEVAYRRAKNIELDEDTKKTMQNIIPATAPENGIVMDGNYRADDKLENVEAIYWKQDSYQVIKFARKSANMDLPPWILGMEIFKNWTFCLCRSPVAPGSTWRMDSRCRQTLRTQLKPITFKISRVK